MRETRREEAKSPVSIRDGPGSQFNGFETYHDLIEWSISSDGQIRRLRANG
jgi:hypothetical protein